MKTDVHSSGTGSLPQVNRGFKKIFDQSDVGGTQYSRASGHVDGVCNIYVWTSGVSLQRGRSMTSRMTKSAVNTVGTVSTVSRQPGCVGTY